MAISSLHLALQPTFWQTVSSVGLRYFSLTTNSCFMGLGLKEFVWDGVVEGCRVDPNIRENASKAARIVHKIELVLWKFSLLHGGFFLASGACGIAAALDTLGMVSLGVLGPVAEISCNVLFLFANILALGFNLKYTHKVWQRYQTVKREEKNPNLTDIEKARLKHERKLLSKRLLSFIPGIISNLNYIIAMSALLFGGPVALVIVFAAIGLTFGAFKILYDLFALGRENSS